MKKINTIVKSLMLLLVAGLMSACNKDGFETIVIEDGQPSVAQMIVGRWQPNGGEIVNPDTGEITEEIDPGEIPWMDIYDDNTGNTYQGGSGSGGSTGGGDFSWNVDEGDIPGPGIGGGGLYDGRGPSFNFGDYHWYIFQLTERVLIIYRFYGDYIIIYYYFRIGDFNVPEPEPEPEPVKNMIIEIQESTFRGATEPSSVNTYRFTYDDEGRIQNYYIINGNYAYDWTYSYKGVEEVYVTGDESYMAYIMRDGGIEYLYNTTVESTDGKLVASPVYDENGYMVLLNNNTFEYENGNLVTFNCRGSVYTYEYTDEKNNANLDLNCFISNCSTYEYDYSHYSLFAPFRFYGKSSENLISKEIWFTGADFDYEYEYEKDSQGRISSIVRKTMSRYNADMLSRTTYTITYAD